MNHFQSHSSVIKTTRARFVLGDVRAALRYFASNPIDIEFRHLVVLCCTLIRTVGDAVKKENKDNRRCQAKARQYFELHIKNDPLFIDFIKSMRDNIQHEYTASVSWASITDINDAHRMEYRIKSGRYEDEDFRDLMTKAIDFWEGHLDQMEKIT